MTTTRRRAPSSIGRSELRPDAPPKVAGRFRFASDLEAEGMLWGATRRSHVPHGRIRRLDVAPALAFADVLAVLTIDDVPGRRTYGLEHHDQPVLADGFVRYDGEPIAIVAARDPWTARRAADAIVVDIEELPPAVDPDVAVAAGELFRHVRVRRGDPDRRGTVVVEGEYEVGMQDQAPLGPEAGLAIPDGDGGLDLHVATQWTHADHEQLVASLGLDPDRVRVHPAGVGGAFGAREDISLQIHLCLLALRTGRPVKMVYGREESFHGHVHRHPARMRYRHEADADGHLVRVEATIVLDGGAYASTSAAVIANAAYFAVGPYRCDTVLVDGYATRTNNPPCGAMRGFGVVQACFGHESQMDRLAAALGMDPVELRLRNALEPGDPFPTTGQIVDPPLPTAACIEAVRAMPLPDPTPSDDPRARPGGTGRTTDHHHVIRGVGYGVSIKNIAFSEGFEDDAEARVALTPEGARVHTAAVEVGQGLTVVLTQIAREVLGLDRVEIVYDHTAAIGSAGSSSASRQTQTTGNAVLLAARQVRDAALAAAGGDDMDDDGVWADGRLVATWHELCADGPIEATVRYRHPPTEAPDENGQGRLHAGFAVAAHRAVVDVDPGLGLVRVVRIDTAQDVGRALNPASVIGQIEGGVLQGVGLAVMEEVVVEDGRIRNPSFTDYLLPTIADAPEVEVVLIEEPGSWGPFGAKGVGEPPAISSTAAVAAAIRAATGRALARVPIRPDDLAL